MLDKQMAVLIGAFAVMGLGGAYWSTLSDEQRCFTQECRDRVVTENIRDRMAKSAEVDAALAAQSAELRAYTQDNGL